MDIRVDRTSVCAADDSIMAMGRMISIGASDDLNSLINTLRQHPDFSLIDPTNKHVFEVWHLQVEDQKIATTTVSNGQFDINIIDSRQLIDIFSNSQELYLRRDVQAFKAYQTNLSQQKEKDRIQKAIDRNRAKKC